jgi:hypothetical protein
MILALLAAVAAEIVFEIPKVFDYGKYREEGSRPRGSRQVVVRARRVKVAQIVLAQTPAEDEQVDWDEPCAADEPGEAGWRKPRGCGLIGA